MKKVDELKVLTIGMVITDLLQALQNYETVCSSLSNRKEVVGINKKQLDKIRRVSFELKLMLENDGKKIVKSEI